MLRRHLPLSALAQNRRSGRGFAARLLLTLGLSALVAIPLSVGQQAEAEGNMVVASLSKVPVPRPMPMSRREGDGITTAQPQAHAALVMDANNGHILYERDANKLRYPASLTKMMTLYLLFEAIDEGKMSLDTQLKVPEAAIHVPPSRLNLVPGTVITVRDAVRAEAVKSANDVAVTIANNLAPNEHEFAKLMNAKAKELGMTRTHFVNASGLGDPRHVTTAHDMAVLARDFRRRFPQYTKYFLAHSFTWKGRTYPATNHLIGKVPGVNGLKTGHINAAGWNLVATVNRNGKKLIVVVLGGKTEQARDQEVTQLIERFYHDS